MTRAIAERAAMRSIIDVSRGGFARALSLLLSILMSVSMAGCTASTRDLEPAPAPIARRNAPPTATDDACALTATKMIVQAVKHRFVLSVREDDTLTQSNAAPGPVAASGLNSRLQSALRSVPRIVAEQIRAWILGRLS